MIVLLVFPEVMIGCYSTIVEENELQDISEGLSSECEHQEAQGEGWERRKVVVGEELIIT